jgi:hypothetical protein
MDGMGQYVMFTFRLQAARVLAFVLAEGDPENSAFLELTNFTMTIPFRAKRFLFLKVPRPALRSIRPPV